MTRDNEIKNAPDIHYPIDGILDLHTFHPRDVTDVTQEYLLACRAEGIYRVRIIHGKGKGVLRNTVHALLEKSAIVKSWKPATDSSGWGATIVALKPWLDSERD